MSENNSKKKSQLTCSDIDCLSSIDWKIMLQGQSFPEVARVDINGVTVINECFTKQKYMIDRSAVPEVLNLENFSIPARGQLKVEVFNMGSDCSFEEVLISNDDVEFEVTKNEDKSVVQVVL